MRISDWSSDVCSSDLGTGRGHPADAGHPRPGDGGLPGDEGRKLLSHDPVGRVAYRYDPAGHAGRGRTGRRSQGAGLGTNMHIKKQAAERHTLSILVDNEAGILARIAGMFTSRGYNIESLTVADVTENHDVTRLNIVTKPTPKLIEQNINNPNH